MPDVIRFHCTAMVPADAPGLWRVRLANGHELLAHPARTPHLASGKNSELNQKEILPGQSLVVVCSPFDLSRGHIESSTEDS